MKQAVLLGRVNGLRPAQKRRLERLSQRRHPEAGGAELLCLQRLAAEARELELPLSLLVDGRGLCRLLWVGPLEQSGRLIERLPGSQRRQGQGWRLISCVGHGPGLEPQGSEALVGLDLGPALWLRFPHQAAAGGQWPAALYAPGQEEAHPWRCQRDGELGALCDPLAMPISSPPEEAEPAATAGPERVLLLALVLGDATASQRDIGELEALVRSAGSLPVGLVQQKRQAGAHPVLWGDGKLREAALEARRLGATLVVTDRELSPFQARHLERLLDLPVSDRSELILDIFAQRAASSAGRLQVELAQLRYRLPRLSGRGQSLSRQGAASAPGGPEKPSWRRIAASLPAASTGCRRRCISSVNTAPACARGARGCGAWPWWATPTPARAPCSMPSPNRWPVRRCWRKTSCSPPSIPPPGGWNHASRMARCPGSCSPTRWASSGSSPPLLEAFRSTLEETLEADGLLIVVDLSDPAWPEQLRTVHAILDSLGSQAPAS